MEEMINYDYDHEYGAMDQYYDDNNEIQIDDEDVDEQDRIEYITQLKQEKQNYVINTRTISSSTILLYTWTHRTTSCDVLSTVTTTITMKNGNMKDIKMYNKEMKRIKAPGKKPGLNLYVSPLEGGANDSNSRSRKLCNDILKNEKITFMNRLYKSRYHRTTLENIAAILIQKLFRGYWIRSHQQLIQFRSKMQFYMRQSILKKYNTPSPCSPSSSPSPPSNQTLSTLLLYRQQHQSKYQLSALIIQCSYRCYLSRIYMNRKRYEYYHLKRYQSIIKIQSLIRQKIGYETVKIKREKNILFLKYKAALLIQSIYRRVLAKRRLYQRRYKLQWLAARIIQTAFRGRNTRQTFALYKAIIQRIKLFKASRCIQCMIRKRIARQRIKRLKMRKLYLKIFQSSLCIQSMIRKYLAFVSIKKRKILLLKNHEIENERKRLLDQELLEQQTISLSNSMNIYLQAELGNISNVDSLYHHEIENNNSYNQEMNSDGNTVLSIAVKYGHLDLVRKCLLWGYDINHINQLGESIISIAAERQYYEILFYLLNYDPATTSTSSSSSSSAANRLILSDEDVGMVITSLAKSLDLKYMRNFLEKYPNKVNISHPINESIALHHACETGNLDMVHLLLQHGSQVDILDDLGQLPIHKACLSSSNIQILKLLLGYSDSDYSTIRCTSNFHRNELLLKKDHDGKDCLLLAALNGRIEIVKSILSILDLNKRIQLLSDISWSSTDILLVNQLASTGNLDCLKILEESGYDLTWVPDTTGTTLMMAACLTGKIRIIDYLIEKGIDMTILDNNGCNCFHYAAQCIEENIIPYLLSYGHKAPETCKLSINLLLVQDKSQGSTPIHYIAQYGSSLSFELLAQDQLNIAMNMPNHLGKTPLIIACEYNQVKTIKQILSIIGSNTPSTSTNTSTSSTSTRTIVNHHDMKGKNALWYYFFPLSIIKENNPNPILLTINPTIENEIIKLLLQAGCDLFSSSTLRDMDHIQQLFDKYRTCSTTTATATTLDVKEKQILFDEIQSLIEPADICAYESKLGILNLFPDLLDSDSCWKLVLSCLYFGTTNNKAFASIYDGNIIPSLLKYDTKVKFHSNPIIPLQSIYYHDINIFGWSIRAKNVPVITYLFRKGVNPNKYVDIHHNTSLHYAVMHGNLSVVDTVLNAHDEILHLEHENDDGYTAAMIASKAGNFHITKKLLRCGCNGRTALRGKYWGWLLAMVREREKLEVNTQTGIYGDDDERYFSNSPDPNYLIWGWK